MSLQDTSFQFCPVLSFQDTLITVLTRSVTPGHTHYSLGLFCHSRTHSFHFGFVLSLQETSFQFGFVLSLQDTLIPVWAGSYPTSLYLAFAMVQAVMKTIGPPGDTMTNVWTQSRHVLPSISLPVTSCCASILPLKVKFLFLFAVW